MSIWAHVAGIIRIDSMARCLRHVDKPNLGVICTWESDDDETTIPSGSEGSLRWSFEETGSKSSLSWGNIHISGDLRDFDNSQEIIDWVKEVTKSDEWWVRQAVITIDIECYDTIIMSMHSGSKNWEIITLSKEKSSDSEE